jgi:hypothetical protein
MILTAKTILVIQLVLAATFAAAASAKWRDLEAFVDGVLNFQIGPARLAKPIAGLFVIGETAVSVSHVTGLYVWITSLVAIALMLAAAVAVAVNLVRDRIVQCHCFSAAGDDLISWWSLVRLATIVVLEATVCYWSVTHSASVMAIMREGALRETILLLVLTCMILALATWLWNLPDAAALVRPCVVCEAEGARK